MSEHSRATWPLKGDPCGCGHEDCWLADFQYWFCRGCGDHHRAPVGQKTCPVEELFPPK